MSTENNNQKGTDLSNLSTDKAEEGVWMELDHPIEGGPLLNDQGDPMKLRLKGKDSKAYEKARRDLFDKGVKYKERKKQMSLAEIENAELELTLSTVCDWEGVQEDGEIVEFSENKARHLLKKYPWMLEQVQEFIDRRENFLGN